MSRMTARFGGVAIVATIAGALLVPANSALAVHERICLTAIESGNYNVIVGAGTIRGTNGDDVIIGSAGPDTIRASNGNDVVCGRGGADTIDGGNGNDDLLGDRGDRDPGPDMMLFTADDVIYLDPAVYGEGGVGGPDTITGGNNNDRLWGDEAEDRLSDSNGNDELRGGGGNDTLNAGNGDDLLIGMGDVDSCNGGTGTDRTDNPTTCESLTSVP